MDPDRLSFVGCFQILKTRMPECPIDPPKRERWFKALRNEMSMEVTDPRRNRINPRVIRVKMSKFGKKQPHHRGISELERSFEDVIIPRSPPQSASA